MFAFSWRYMALHFLSSLPSRPAFWPTCSRTRPRVCPALMTGIIRFIEDRYYRRNIMLLWILHAFILSTHPADTKQPARSPVAARFDHSSKCCCHRERWLSCELWQPYRAADVSWKADLYRLVTRITGWMKRMLKYDVQYTYSNGLRVEDCWMMGNIHIATGG